MNTIMSTISDFIPDDIKLKVIQKSIDAIAYFRRASKLKLIFSTYLQKRYDQLSLMKTLLYRNEPVRLNECYVRNSVTLLDNNGDQNIIEDNRFVDFILSKKRVIVSGSAGLGKSVLCKSIFLEMVNRAVGIYPIFIELRDFNNHYNYSLLEYICLELSDVKNKINTTSLEGLIKSGNLLLILDGFDELDFEIRNRYSREILDLSKKYKNINLLISTRPDETFKSWGQFYEVNINELDKKKAIELVSKLRYNDVVKRQFMKKIDEELYDTHKSFIGNPLLLTMMLMTFQEFAEIPKKVYLFYEQAFQTLFLKHDSLKDLYIRKSRSGMDILGFKKVFSYFCIHTHLKKEISFSEELANEILTSALKNLGMTTIKSTDVLSDLMSNLCLLHRDGTSITFSHRSFQEYFSALYLKDLPHPDKLYQLIDKVVLSNSSDICGMLYEMNDELVEKMWVYPKVKSMLSEINTSLERGEKEIRIKDIIDFVLIKKSIENGKEVFQTVCLPKSSINSYNYIMFTRDLWNFFYEKINLSFDEIQDVLLFSLDKSINDVLNELISKISGDHTKVVKLDFDLAKSKLDFNSYYRLVNVFYKKVCLDKVSLLVKVKDYIDGRQMCSQDNIESLLSL